MYSWLACQGHLKGTPPSTPPVAFCGRGILPDRALLLRLRKARMQPCHMLALRTLDGPMFGVVSNTRQNIKRKTKHLQKSNPYNGRINITSVENSM